MTHEAGGAIIRRLRRERNLTLYMAQDWAALSPEALGNIERGVTRQPPPETLDHILDSLHAATPVPLAARNALLEAYGYRPRFPLPTDAEIAWAREQWWQETRDVSYPAYLVDCAQRILAWNHYALRLINLPLGHQLERLFAESTIFDLAFNPNYRAALQIDNPDDFLPQMVYVLKCEFLAYTQEAWYADCINTPLQRYPMFRALWEAIPDDQLGPLGQRTMGPLVCRHPDGTGQLSFRLLGAAFMSDPRFRGVQYTPADVATIRQCLIWAEEELT